jgi:hypothetical protein
MPIATNSRKNMLLGYHYTLRQQAKQLAKERIEIKKRKDSAIAASNTSRRARSDASYMNGKRHHRHGSRFETPSTQKGKASPKPRLVFPISRRARKHYIKNSRSSIGGSSSISTYNATKSRRSEGTYASSSTKSIEDGRQQIVSERGGGISQQRSP